jgi:CheY-like chemotaxis protein
VSADTRHTGASRPAADALTGWGQEQDHRRSRQVGFDHHLVKPPDIEKLCDVLKGAVAGR